MIRSLVVALSLSIASPAIAAVAPLSFQVFCAQNPAECVVSAAVQIDLTEQSLAALKAVNVRVNRAITPRADAVDSWALNPAFGDCEDFAASKRHALIAAGFPAGALRFGIGKLPSGESHAVLVAMTSAGPLILDNLADAVVPLGKSGVRLTMISGANPKVWESVQ